ncbi:MAG: hypothetical protein HYU28_03860 [Actinobacteria bacterium]|nr:hypothetical protein [Actinomycetota bacterium]
MSRPRAGARRPAARAARAARQSGERALWPLAILVVLLVGLPTAAWIRSAVRGEPEPVPITETPDAYRVVYLVEALSAGGAAPSTEDVLVRRPFEGRVEIRAGEPPGGEVLSVVVSGFARQERRSGSNPGVAFVVEPGPPSGDTRLDGALDGALDRDTLTFQDERRTVLGRRCAVYRVDVRSPSGRFEGDARDLCIDAAGFVLAEEYRSGGTVRRRRTAVEVDVSPTIGGNAFAITGAAVPLRDGGGALRELTPDSRVEDATVYELPADPEGFRPLGRYAISPASPVGDTGIIPSGVRAVGVLDVWQRGPDFVAVFNGGTDDKADPFLDDPSARAVDLGPIGEGETALSLAGGEVRVDLGEGRFVRVFGTVSIDRLVALARELEPKTSGQIIPLPPRS